MLSVMGVGGSTGELLLLPASVRRMLGALVPVVVESEVAFRSFVRRVRTMTSKSIHSLICSARSASFWSWERMWFRRPVSASPGMGQLGSFRQCGQSIRGC